MKRGLFFLLVLGIIGILLMLLQSKKKEKAVQVITSQPASTSQFHTSSGSPPEIPLSLPNGYTIHVFAKNLGNPRDLVYSPGGTLLVSNPGDNTVIALPDQNHDGVADSSKVIISGENHPHGLAFYNNFLFVADVDNVVRYTWDEKTLTATQDKVLFSLPQNNDHNNRAITFDQNGTMYISVGSTCDVCKEAPALGGSIWISNANGDNPHVFATGLRNAAFLAINPVSKKLWATEMGRDYLGDNVPPDEIDIVTENKNYGWPFCYGNRIHDTNFDSSSKNPCDTTESPIYEIPAHAAPLGLTFINSPQFPHDWQNDLLVAYHGSWNRSEPIGYKVVHLKVHGNAIAGTVTDSEDFLTGFAPSSTPHSPGNTSNAAIARPVDLIFDNAGNLYLSDDKGGNIFIIQKNR